MWKLKFSFKHRSTGLVAFGWKYALVDEENLLITRTFLFLHTIWITNSRATHLQNTRKNADKVER